jgi:hypothetical protein
MSYDDFFVQVTGNAPFPYQRRLADPQSPLPPCCISPRAPAKACYHSGLTVPQVRYQ